MRRALAALLVAIICSLTPANAQQTPQIGLYIDDSRSEHCDYGTDYYPVNVYAWAKPGENGMKSMMLQVLYPDVVIPAYLVFNEAIVIGNDGIPQTGIQVVFDGCQDDGWVWGFYQTVLCTSTEPGLVQVYPAARFLYHERIGFGILNCLYYPEVTFEKAEPVSNVCINFCFEDVKPPRIEELRMIDNSTLEVVFTEEVTAASAEDIGNYFTYNRLTEGDTISPASATLLADNTTVELILASPLDDNTPYILRVSRVADPTGNMWELLRHFGNGPDLVATELIHPDTLAGCMDEFSVIGKVANIGQFPVMNTVVHLLYEGVDWDGNLLETISLSQRSLGTTAAGETKTVDFGNYYPWQQNEYFHSLGRFVLLVDHLEYADEAREDNNELVSPFVVLPPREVTYTLLDPVVRADFQRSLLDNGGVPDPVTSYEILCSDNWTSGFEVVAVVEADGSPEYSGNFLPSHTGEFSVLYIRAVRPAAGTTFYYDYCREWHRTGADLPPAAPDGFTGIPVDGDMYLEWEANTEQDLFFYVLEWSETEEFPPVSDPPGYPYGELVHVTHFTHYGWDPGDELYYRLCAVDSAGNCSDFVIIEPWHYSTDASVFMPEHPLTLYQNHPNPFNPSTTIRFYLPERCPVRLEVFDVSGRRMACLIENHMDKGAYAAEWNGEDAVGNNAASGVYFYRLTAGKKTIAKKMILLR